MQIIRHRTNRLADLALLDRSWGAEIDIRSRNGRLILSHDPHKNGEPFDRFVQSFSRRGQQGPLVLNTKEDGLEEEILKTLKRFQVNNYFFLDTTVPTTVRLAVKGNLPYFAVRASEFEPVEAALRFKNRVDWVWVDCFSGRPAPVSMIRKLAAHFRVCLVSPELPGYPLSAIRRFKGLGLISDAVCTKAPELWK